MPNLTARDLGSLVTEEEISNYFRGRNPNTEKSLYRYLIGEALKIQSRINVVEKNN